MIERGGRTQVGFKRWAAVARTELSYLGRTLRRVFFFFFLPRPDLDGDNERYVKSITFNVGLPAVITTAESVDGASR